MSHFPDTPEIPPLESSFLGPFGEGGSRYDNEDHEDDLGTQSREIFSSPHPMIDLDDALKEFSSDSLFFLNDPEKMSMLEQPCPEEPRMIINQPMYQPMYQPMNQLMNQPMNQLMNQTFPQQSFSCNQPMCMNQNSNSTPQTPVQTCQIVEHTMARFCISPGCVYDKRYLTPSDWKHGGKADKCPYCKHSCLVHCSCGKPISYHNIKNHVNKWCPSNNRGCGQQDFPKLKKFLARNQDYFNYYLHACRTLNRKKPQLKRFPPIVKEEDSLKK